MLVRILVFLFTLDIWLLFATMRVLTLCVEWFSWTRRGMERGMMAGYAVGMVIAVSRRTTLPMWVAVPLMVVGCGLALLGMWEEHKRTDQSRLYKMVTCHWAQFRLATIAIDLGLAIIFCAAPPHRLQDAGFVVAQAAYVLFHYSTSLPENGEPGRKRKLALAELKRMFGSSWMPQPQPTTRCRCV